MKLRPVLPFALRQVVAATRLAADFYDACPLAVHNLAVSAMHAHFDRAEAAAMGDPVYAEIQARRISNHGYLREMSAIRERITAQPAWLPLAQYLYSRPARTANLAPVQLVERALRGWSDEDTWDLGTSLCTALGPALKHLADTSWTWPGPPKYLEPEDWTAALRHAADGLHGWATRYDEDDKRAPAGDTLTGADLAAESERRAVAESIALADAQAALRWVADNLRDLWD